ncbi:uncharacterized protein RCC_12191 [Ramularia collo-cygni]|uniref:Uncharacterized protein n=1 Tax=Ramularia collo-cygni TaxID=112498 RepID=A0A2D3V0P0_9PEZI|nr:uncharacterized protein RCC_12191 [Ramularia collo-cygni]CZT22946.1 uncharacterized protein RCC_12191 [Ramularia collo-cygni]
MRPLPRRTTPFKRRSISPETEAEREAKRLHIESHRFDEPEFQAIVKEEEPSDEIIYDAPFANAQARRSSRQKQAIDGHASDLEMSFQVLANLYYAHLDESNLVQGAFVTVRDRRRELICDTSSSTARKTKIEQWLAESFRSLNLPEHNLEMIGSALRKAELSHIIPQWMAKFGANEFRAAVQLLQDVDASGEHGVADVVQLLREQKESAKSAEPMVLPSPRSITPSRTPEATKTPKSGKTVARLKSRAKVDPGKVQQTQCGQSANADASSKDRRTTDQQLEGNRGVAATRGKSMPPTLHAKRRVGQQDAPQTTHSSSPFLDEYRRNGDLLKRKSSSGGSVVKRKPGPDSTTNEPSPVRQSPLKPTSSPIAMVRYVRPDNYNLLVFFIGPRMNTVSSKAISGACWDAFSKAPLQTHRWSEGIWFVRINDVQDVFTDLWTVNGDQFTATPTNSDPHNLFVATYIGTQIDGDVLQRVVEDAVAECHPVRSGGRIVLYRTPYVQDKRQIVFLHLAKSPEKFLLQAVVPDVSGKSRSLMFKPAIKDCQAPCFYCDQMHDEIVCPGADQLSRFSVPSAKKR